MNEREWWKEMNGEEKRIKMEVDEEGKNGRNKSLRWNSSQLENG